MKTLKWEMTLKYFRIGFVDTGQYSKVTYWNHNIGSNKLIWKHMPRINYKSHNLCMQRIGPTDDCFESFTGPMVKFVKLISKVGIVL